MGAADAAVAKECHLKRAVHAAVRKAVVQAQNRKHQPRDKRAATGAKAAQEALQNPGKYAPGYATASGASGTLGQSLTCYMETSGGLATATRRAADKNYPGSPAEKIQWRELKDAAFAASKNLKDAQNAEANTAADTAEAAALQALVDAAWVG
ncbi:hypothetical protein GCM10010329_86590 [Streptomyces spiroverticillatus]|uniref:Uncharacterized protein n=1 Tax=Streptomyces finlayi TaxID=67296 RepID=A0A919CG59_9ACTN|nr:hypothetical protein GCM10010329_86590 [Streptomyces spiroverticillatus]GHD20255.1 hypothetical protein GCM10010334_84480 [Streptomyces finlayi]